MLLLVLAEFIAKKILKKDEQVSIVYAKNNRGNHLNKYKYTEIDPLLGWAMPKSELNKKNIESKYNCAVLRNIINTKSDTLIIFITGGSTSDIALFSYNWPSYLFKKLIGKNINIIIFNGAVAGYGSSQELLKFVRDGLSTSPEIYISYSGANENVEPYYVSGYSYELFSNYKNNFRRESFILPNLVFLIKKTFHLERNNISLKQNPKIVPSEQWLKNESIMNSISESKNIKFYGILQPVAGIANLKPNENNTDIDNRINEYQDFYPKIKSDLLKNKPNYLFDFTNIFNKIEKPFLDDCHVKEEYQHIIADSLFQLIIKDINLRKYSL